MIQKSKNSIKIFLLFLLISLFAAMVSCDNADLPVESDKPAENITTTEQPEQEKEVLGVPQQDYEGYEFKVISPVTYNEGKIVDEVYMEEETGDPINDAVYKRTRQAEEYLNVTIKSMKVANVAQLDMGNHVKNSVMAGSVEFDAIINLVTAESSTVINRIGKD